MQTASLTERCRSRADAPGHDAPPLHVALLTGAQDKSYAIGLATSLLQSGASIDFIGSDSVDGPSIHGHRNLTFLNLRGNQDERASLPRKALRLALYYARLLGYAATARPRIFHILWNNKFEVIDRTVLMLFYRLMGRRVTLTAHNVNAARRDGRDSLLNRTTLRIQYRLCSHIFVHTERMRAELLSDFAVAPDRITVIPFGINETLPNTAIGTHEARSALGIDADERVALFFGQIAPYKGLGHLVDALPGVFARDSRFRLVVAGKVKKGCEAYWEGIDFRLRSLAADGRVTLRIEHIPDAEAEIYFKAADVLLLPYVEIFQSGLPFLAYSFGLPVIASDVGSLPEDVVEGFNGFVFRARDAVDLARAIERYFSSDMYVELALRRKLIHEHASERYSWSRVAALTMASYRMLDRRAPRAV